MTLRPNINNLRARARALDLLISRTTTERDRRDFGHHLYVVHQEGIDPDNMDQYSLYGAQQIICGLEKS
ncbi:hypothetical protein [uncultured Paraglaciecola sp.]|uniref:hypothetical protein n=1 Tax=uncultured Paraglaciecola sp. TaxID=1765024 RepID=UPI00261A7B7A|nr:hypothetical protein [uncultured Paraglaciecola sp.]